MTIDPLTETRPLPPVDPVKYPPLNPNERWMLQKQLEGSHDDETFGAEISYARRLVATIEAVEAERDQAIIMYERASAHRRQAEAERDRREAYRPVQHSGWCCECVQKRGGTP